MCLALWNNQDNVQYGRLRAIDRLGFCVYSYPSGRPILLLTVVHKGLRQCRGRSPAGVVPFSSQPSHSSRMHQEHRPVGQSSTGRHTEIQEGARSAYRDEGMVKQGQPKGSMNG